MAFTTGSSIYECDVYNYECDVYNYEEVKVYNKPHSKVLKLEKTRKYCTTMRTGCPCGCISKERVPQLLKHLIRSNRTQNKSNMKVRVKNGDVDDYYSSYTKSVYRRACVKNDVGIYAKKNHISYEKAMIESK